MAHDDLKAELSGSSLFNNSLAKGLAVVRAFSASKREMNLPEIAETAGITKSAAQRFTFTLEAMGYLRKDSKTKRYSLTPKCLDLGFGYLRANWLIDHANPFLLDLNRKCGETVNMSEPDGNDMIFVARFPSHHDFAVHMPVGMRLPIFCTASGRAYLSALPSEEARQILSHCQPQRFTPSTITDLDAVADLVEEARNKGFAYAKEEYYRGDIAIAAPVRNAQGKVLGAINVSLPSSRWTLESGVKKLAPLVLEIASSITTSPPSS
jgi:IclR family pca regulon transcriptional regulator